MKAASNRVGLYYKAETNWGETPSGGAFTQLRYTGETLDRNKNTQRSNTIRDDRMTDELAVLGFESAGDLDFELSYGSWDAWLEQLLGGTWTTLSLATLTLTVAATAKTITRSAGSWITDGLVAGAVVKFGGLSTPANNSKFLISSLTATVLTVEDPDAVLVDEGPTASCTADADFLQNGIVERSLVLEKRFTDITQFQWFNGIRLSSLDLDVTAQQLITGKWSMIGKDASAITGSTVSGSTVAAVVNKIMSASANVGHIVMDGASLATGIKAVKLSVTNDLRKQDIIGQQATGGIGYGSFQAKGSMDAYFEDAAMVSKVINHTKTAFNFRVTDADGKMLIFCLPALYFTKGNPKSQAQNQDVMVPLEFETVRDASSNSMITVSRFAA